MSLWISCAVGQTCTGDLNFFRVALYCLSYHGLNILFFVLWALRDLNPRPFGCKPNALSRCAKCPVPRAGLEPARSKKSIEPQSIVFADYTTWALIVFRGFPFRRTFQDFLVFHSGLFAESFSHIVKFGAPHFGLFQHFYFF